MSAEPTPVRLSGDLCAAMPIGTELVGCEGYWKGASYVKTTRITWAMFHKRPTPEQVWEAVEGRKNNISPHPSGLAYVYGPPAKATNITDPTVLRAGDVATIERGGATITAPVHQNHGGDGAAVNLDLGRESFIAVLTGTRAWRLISATREVPDSTTLTVPFGPKMLREALCVAQHAVRTHVTADNHHGAPEALEALIRECDRHRPLGPDGKHGQRHTLTCGCDDVPERYRPDGEWKPGTVGTATVRGVEGVTVMRTEGGGTLDIRWLSSGFVNGERGHDAEHVTDFVPDDAEALRARVTELEAEVEADRAAINAAGQYLIPVDRASEGLAGDARELRAEVERLTAALDQAEERARVAERDARDEHAEVERVRAARTLPTREQVAEVLWLNEYQRPWASANREDRAVCLSAAVAVIARMGGSE